MSLEDTIKEDRIINLTNFGTEVYNLLSGRFNIPEDQVEDIGKKVRQSMPIRNPSGRGPSNEAELDLIYGAKILQTMKNHLYGQKRQRTLPKKEPANEKPELTTLDRINNQLNILKNA